MTNAAPPPARDALAGVKVLDLMWVVAGPSITRVMADFGATVVRVESSKRIDMVRTVLPYYNGQPAPENSAGYDNFNTGKLGMVLDLGREEGRAVIRDLAAWADIVAESFAPGVMAKLGLGYATLRARNPDLIMLSTCLFGQSGPLGQVSGIGTMGAALGGFVNLAGFPDGVPVGPFGAYTDYLAPRFALAALLAALDHRDRTGEGCSLDQSQTESALHFLTPTLLDYTVNGRVAQRDGNRDPAMAPHGVYPTRGEDRWIAIAVRDERDWERLCAVMRRPDLATDLRFADLAARKTHEDALDAIVAEWTRDYEGADLERVLLAQGAPAAVLRTTADALRDPQLQHRGHWVTFPDPVHGKRTVEATRFRLSATPARYVRSAPSFGRDTDPILRDILGYDDDRIALLAASGALE